MKRFVLLVVAVVVPVVLLTVCGCPSQQETLDQTPSDGRAQSPDAATAEGDEVLILCGTSFRPPVERLKEMFEEESGHKMALSFGGSEDLLPNVKMQTEGDLFVTHDPYVDYTKEAGALARWVHVGYVAPVLVVKKGNPKKITGLDDLAQEGLQVVLPNPEFSTCGEMVFALLEKKGIKDAVLKNVGNAMFRSHSDIGNKMQLGYGDAAVMWNGVAHNFLDAVEIVPGPYEYDEEIRVGVIGLSYSDKAAVVEEFLKFVDTNGRAVFEEFGYVK